MTVDPFVIRPDMAVEFAAFTALQPQEGLRTLTSAVYAHLRSDILSCRYRPGEKLLIAPIGKRFDVSLAIVREALSRLVADRLVSAHDQRGFRVSELSLADLDDTTHTRIELETLALRRSILRGDNAWEANLERTYAELIAIPYGTQAEVIDNADKWGEKHDRFHGALVAACGLDWLLHFRAVLFERSERYRRLSRIIGGPPRDTFGEHQAIYMAARERNVGIAVGLIEEHFRRTANAIATVCRQRGVSDVITWRDDTIFDGR